MVLRISLIWNTRCAFNFFEKFRKKKVVVSPDLSTSTAPETHEELHKLNPSVDVHARRIHQRRRQVNFGKKGGICVLPLLPHVCALTNIFNEVAMMAWIRWHSKIDWYDVTDGSVINFEITTESKESKMRASDLKDNIPYQYIVYNNHTMYLPWSAIRVSPEEFDFVSIPLRV